MSLEWIEGVPADWRISKAQFVLDYQKRDVQEDDEIVTAFRDGQVTLRRNRRTDGFTMAEKEIGYQHICEGDLVVHSMDGGFGAIGVSDSCGKASPVVHAYTSSLCDLRFVAYQLRAAVKAGWIAALAKGIRVRSTQFDRPALESLNIAYPTVETQRRIADYLDRETSEIDAAVADLDKYVELLEKRRRAKITFAVEGKSNLVKDNSTESHPVANLGLVAHAYQPETLSMEALNQSGTFSVFGANGIIGRHDNFNHEQPQVVIACRGNTCGAVNWTLPKSWINGNAMVINPHAEKLRKDFLFYVLEIADYSLVITGSAQPQIIRESLYRLRVPLPPLETQRRIADYLDRETTEIDSLIADSTRLRDLLLKRRSVLITEVVTGRKQV